MNDPAGTLLRDAVGTSTAERDQRAGHADHLAIRIRLRQQIERCVVPRDMTHGHDHGPVREVVVHVGDHRRADAVQIDPPVHRPVHHVQATTPRVPNTLQELPVLFEPRSVRVVISGRDRQHHDAGPNVLGQPVDMAVRVAILDEPMGQPDHDVDAEG
jgi:hypothetical protein